MKKKIVVMMLMTCMCASGLFGCGGSTAAPTVESGEVQTEADKTAEEDANAANTEEEASKEDAKEGKENE